MTKSDNYWKRLYDRRQLAYIGIILIGAVIDGWFIYHWIR
jgi:hypothetical protein